MEKGTSDQGGCHVAIRNERNSSKIVLRKFVISGFHQVFNFYLFADSPTQKWYWSIPWNQNTSHFLRTPISQTPQACGTSAVEHSEGAPWFTYGLTMLSADLATSSVKEFLNADAVLMCRARPDGPHSAKRVIKRHLRERVAAGMMTSASSGRRAFFTTTIGE